MEKEPVTSSVDGTTIMAPKGASEEKLREAFATARERGLAGQTVDIDSLSEPTSAQAPPQQEEASPTPAQVPIEQRVRERQERNVSDVTRLKQAEQNMAPAPMEQRVQERMANQPKTTLGGLLGGAARGAAPYVGPALAGAATGAGTAAMGLAAPAMFATDLIMGTINRVAGTNYPSTREAFNRVLSQYGIEDPDTASEQVLQNVVDSGLAAQGIIGLANQLAPAAAGQLSATTTTQGAAQQMAANPQQQIRGALRAPIGGELAAQGAEALGAEETGQNIARMAGALGTDMAASAGTVPGQRTVENARRRMGAANITPDEARAAIRTGAQRANVNVPSNEGRLARFAREELGIGSSQGSIDVRRSDVFPPDSPLAHAFQGLRDAFGGAALASKQQTGRNALMRDVLEGYGLSVSKPQDLSPALAREFAEPRRTAFTRYGNMKQQALDTVPPDDIIPVDNTVGKIDEIIEELQALGGANANVNLEGSPSLTPGDAAQSNVYQSMISRLEQWKAAFQNNTIEGLERNRRNFGNRFIPDKGYGELDAEERNIIRSVYDAVRTDIGEAVQRHGGEEQFNNWKEANAAMYDLQEDMQRAVIGDLLKPLKGQNNTAIARGEMPLEELSEEARQTVERLVQEPETLSNIFVNGTPSQIKTVMPYMSESARKQALGVMLQNDMQQSIPNVRDLSGNALANNLKDSFNRREIVMTPQDEEVIDGMGLLLDLTRRAEPAARRQAPNMTSSLPTAPGVAGMMLRGMTANIGALIGTLFGGAVAGRSLATMYESPEIRDMLIDLVEAGQSPRGVQIANSIIRQVLGERGEDTQAAAESVGEEAAGAVERMQDNRDLARSPQLRQR